MNFLEQKQLRITIYNSTNNIISGNTNSEKVDKNEVLYYKDIILYIS
jgi:hypothetical protein